MVVCCCCLLLLFARVKGRGRGLVSTVARLTSSSRQHHRDLCIGQWHVVQSDVDDDDSSAKRTIQMHWFINSHWHLLWHIVPYSKRRILMVMEMFAFLICITQSSPRLTPA